MEIHIHDTPEVLPICESHLRGLCKYGDKCPEHHSPLPYVWQVCLDWRGWIPLKPEECEFLENKFSIPANATAVTKMTLPDENNKPVPLDIMVIFETMRMAVKPEGQKGNAASELPVRRLSTMTFAKAITENDNVDDPASPKYCTQWRWYYEDPAKQGVWQAFEMDGFTPMQWTIEEKFEAKQEIYRFDATTSPRGLETFMINFIHMKIISPKRQQEGNIRRRPLFLSQQDRISGKCLSYPLRKKAPFNQNIPSNWYPLDPTNDYELVPLNPESMEFHLVTSELVRSLPKDRQIFDVFRLQNAFLWHKYCSKRTVMEHKGIELNELQLFHGTSPDSVVQAIFRQNFDPRLCGRNMVAYGKGSYFARDASYSDKYTCQSVHLGPGQFRWMFMARVLAGRYTKGNSNYVRPPPIDATDPHSDLFDSCVDRENHPNIYVIFDNDQVYPEYVVSYR